MMIDPRFANAGAAPFLPGFGVQQPPVNYHHHRHHKHKSRKDQSPLSRDESIHKVDHGQTHAFQYHDAAPYSNGYGVPYGGFTQAPPGVYQQPPAQYFTGPPIAYANQYSGLPFPQSAFGGPQPGPQVRHHRRHHRHHRHHAGEANNAAGVPAESQAVPEQLIGQRSSSVLGGEGAQARSPIPTGDGGAPVTEHRHHHHRHHRQHHSKEAAHPHQSAGSDGYGHLNGDLIFIERGEHSPHRQTPPSGYEYKGKIEVQGAERERRSRSRGKTNVFPPQPQPIPMPPPVGPVFNRGPCPPGWQQVVLSAAPGGPCPPGGTMFSGQVAGGYAQTGLANLAASYPIPSQGQVVADYIVESGGAAGRSSSTEAGYTTVNQQTNAGGGFAEHFQSTEVGETISGRSTIIEVWQKRSKSETREKSRSRSRSRSRQHRSRTRSPKTTGSFDFERFRQEILIAIEGIVQRGPGPGKINWTGHDGGTQTQLHPSVVGTEGRRDQERRHDSGTGEVRVIVQPIQPVFYMPRQMSGGAPILGGPGPATDTHPQVASGGPNVVYVPRNVYVPVIKPVFVPRERVIVRPQVIHVARPVLVDRPVPVTQRPIIIDRERPVPVPVRGAEQGAAAQSGASNVVREEYVYRDNLPVAYGGRCAEFVGGVNYGYTPAHHQEQHYASSSTQEMSSNYPGQGPIINVNVPEQFHQQSQSSSHVEVRPEVGSFHGSYSNLAQAGSGLGAVNVGQKNQQVIQQTLEQSARVAGVSANLPTQIEILDTAVNPFWQKTDQSTLMRRYGRPAYEIVHKTDQVEQQMYTELRQSGNVEIQRSASSASYGSGSGVGMNIAAGGGGLGYDAASIPPY